MNREFEKKYARDSFERPAHKSGKSAHPYDIAKQKLVIRHYNARARLQDALDHSEVRRYTIEYDNLCSEMKKMFGDGPVDPYKKNAYE